MSNNIDFYFDVISPYAYIAYKKIATYKKIIFNYKPIFLGGLHNLTNITPPAFNKFKMKNMKNDCNIIAKKNNIEFNWNSKFPINSLHIMRGYLYVNEDKKKDYLHYFFEAYWRDNKDLSNKENIINILDLLKIDNSLFFNSINKKKIKNKLIKLTNEAFEKEIFGAPTFIANDKIFWGQDRLEYAIEELNYN